MRAINAFAALLQGLALLSPSHLSASAMCVERPTTPEPAPQAQISSHEASTNTPSLRTVVHRPADSSTLAVPPSEPTLPLPRPTPTAVVLDLRRAGLAARDGAAGGPAAPPVAMVTEAPGVDGAAAANGVPLGGGNPDYITGVGPDGRTFVFRQTTYYSCVPKKATTRCGWFEPVVEISGGERAPGNRAGVAALVAAGAVGYLLGR